MASYTFSKAEMTSCSLLAKIIAFPYTTATVVVYLAFKARQHIYHNSVHYFLMKKGVNISKLVNEIAMLFAGSIESG